jgi:hypothetical protein
MHPSLPLKHQPPPREEIPKPSLQYSRESNYRQLESQFNVGDSPIHFFPNPHATLIVNTRPRKRQEYPATCIAF